MTGRINRAFWIYAFLVLSVTAVSWILYLHDPVFYLRPLYTQDDQFNDLLNYLGKIAHLHDGAAALGAGVPVFTYPAPAAYVYKILLFTFPGHAVRTYLVFLGVCVSGFAAAAWCGRGVNKAFRLSLPAAILTTAYFGYPLWFTADRCNIEGVVWALSGAGVCFLLRGRYRAAAVLIGIAASIKPFPVLFLLPLLGRRKYKEAALGIVTAGLLTVAALTALGPNPWTAYKDLRPGVALYMEGYILNFPLVDEMRSAHSLLDGMKSAALTVEMGGIRPHKALSEVPKLSDEPGGWHVLHRLARVYPFIALIGFGLVCAAFFKMPLLNQLTALAVVITLFPLSAQDYTLLHLYVPFGALLIFLTRDVADGRVALPRGSMLAFMVIYALLLAPLSPLMIYAGDVKLLLLVSLLFVAARSPMPSAYFGDSVATAG